MNKLYHTEVGIPERHIAVVRNWELDLTWSRHAKEEALNDKYGTLHPGSYPRRLTGHWTLIEVEEGPNGCPVKIVVRRPVDERRSLVLAILRDGPHTGLVKTCWTNLNTDTHATLDKSKYSRP